MSWIYAGGGPLVVGTPTHHARVSSLGALPPPMLLGEGAFYFSVIISGAIYRSDVQEAGNPTSSR
jgi:hypothetical protein